MKKPLRYQARQPRLLPNNWTNYKISAAFATAAHPFSSAAAKAEAERFFRRTLRGKLATHRFGGRYK